MTKPIFLGVNIDHVATLRQARGTTYPDPIEAAKLAVKAGADSITIHLREDRRHIQDDDAINLIKLNIAPINLELALNEEVLQIAEQLKPTYCCLVPEKRQELTTEGGLDVISQQIAVTNACLRLSNAGSRVSLFIDPDLEQIDAAKACGAAAIELHTGCYANKSCEFQQKELKQLKSAAEYADSLDLIVNAGHGLHMGNTSAIAAIPCIHELNIGHSIIAQALFSGLEKTVSDIKTIMQKARQEIHDFC